MMKKTILSFALSFAFVFCQAGQWAPVGEDIKTVWAEQLDPSNPLPAYPRPQM